MNYTTLLKSSLWVGGGIMLGRVLNQRIIAPQLGNLEMNETVKALIGPAVLAGAVYLGQDMLPQKVSYGVLGLAGVTAIQSTVGNPLAQEQEQEQSA